MLKVVVKRDKWLRGEGGEDSYLLREEDGRMCCLGFAALAAGFTPADIICRRNPRDITAFYERDNPFITATVTETEWRVQHKSETCDLMSLNDDESVTDEEREQQVIEIGKKIGIEFTFED